MIHSFQNVKTKIGKDVKNGNEKNVKSQKSPRQWKQVFPAPIENRKYIVHKNYYLHEPAFQFF